jgi:Ca2+-binding RTX toxin-like protein
MLGTSSSDRLRIDRETAGGPLTISANRPIKTEGDCTLVAPKEAECVVSKFGSLLGELEDGADRLRIVATQYSIVIFGENGDDRMIGGRDRDFLGGGGGDDRLVGQQGGDDLAGNAGNDSLIGEGGADALNGGSGRDQCTGGPGRDRKTKC